MRVLLVLLVAGLVAPSLAVTTAIAAPELPYDLQMLTQITTINGITGDTYNLFNPNDPDGFQQEVQLFTQVAEVIDYPPPDANVPLYAEAQTRADLRRGQFGVYTNSPSSWVPPSNGYYAAQAVGQVAFNDLILFNTSDDALGLTVRLTIRLEGTMVTDLTQGHTRLTLGSQFSQQLSGGGQIDLESFYYDEFIDETNGHPVYYSPNWQRDGDLFSYDFVLSGPDPVLALSTTMTGQSTHGVTNFFGTAAFGLVLPDGVTFTTGSGAFLAAIPEPSTGLLVMTGLLGLAARWQRGSPRRATGPTP